MPWGPGCECGEFERLPVGVADFKIGSASYAATFAGFRTWRRTAPSVVRPC